jgi:hypothetical protein
MEILLVQNLLVDAGLDNTAKKVEATAHLSFSLDNITYMISVGDIRHRGEIQRGGRKKENCRV